MKKFYLLFFYIFFNNISLSDDFKNSTFNLNFNNHIYQIPFSKEIKNIKNDYGNFDIYTNFKINKNNSIFLNLENQLQLLPELPNKDNIKGVTFKNFKIGHKFNISNLEIINSYNISKEKNIEKKLNIDFNYNFNNFDKIKKIYLEDLILSLENSIKLNNVGYMLNSGIKTNFNFKNIFNLDLDLSKILQYKYIDNKHFFNGDINLKLYNKSIVLKNLNHQISISPYFNQYILFAYNNNGKNFKNEDFDDEQYLDYLMKNETSLGLNLDYSYLILNNLFLHYNNKLEFLTYHKNINDNKRINQFNLLSKLGLEYLLNNNTTFNSEIVFYLSKFKNENNIYYYGIKPKLNLNLSIKF